MSCFSSIKMLDKLIMTSHGGAKPRLRLEELFLVIRKKFFVTTYVFILMCEVLTFEGVL
jgi:hypothetical protein